MTAQTSSPIKAETAIGHAIGDLLTARQAITQAITSRGLYFGDRPTNDEEIDLLEVYHRLTDVLMYAERKRKALIVVSDVKRIRA